MCHEIFNLQFFSWFEPIWAPDIQAKIFSNSVSISRDIRSQSLKNLTKRCASHRGVKILVYAIPKKGLQIFSYIIEYCSLPQKGILLIVPLKATRDSQRFWFWLRCVQFDSAVWCTLSTSSFFHDSNPIWAPDKQAKIFSNLFSISQRFSNF